MIAEPVARPSDPLLKLLRDALLKRGLSTIDLASKVGMGRAELKKRLAGGADLTIDQFLILAQALDLQKHVVGLAGQEFAAEEEGAVAGDESVSAVHTLRASSGDSSTPGLDPFENPARELVRGGFGWELDMFLQFDVALLQGSGVPESVLRKFPETLPIRLESRWHRHNRPDFGDDALSVTLSFDSLLVCSFPWAALRTVSFTLPVDTSAPVTPEPAPSSPRPVLRLVKE